MPCPPEISRIRVGGSSGRWRASARIARQAYSALAEIFMKRNALVLRHMRRSQSGHRSGRRSRSSRAVVHDADADGRAAARSELAAVEGMQAALGLGLAGPSARAL